ncbi:hypothetical protein PENTCL1PPCAC_21041, partial [Pristionchus entomophagus]
MRFPIILRFSSSVIMHDFFNTHPVLPSIIIFSNVFAFLPIAFMICLVQKTPLHGNCRYLFNAWLGGYFGLFIVNISLACVALTDDNGFLTRSIRSPPHRELLYGLCSSGTLYCSMAEIALAVERIYSTIDPEQYHQSPLAISTLVPLTIFMIDLSILMGRLAYECNEFVLIGTFVLVCDILTVVTNTLSVNYNRKRFKVAFDNLNAKYQAKEAFQLSAAMQPVYIAIFCVKCVIVTSAVIMLEMDDPYFNG